VSASRKTRVQFAGKTWTLLPEKAIYSDSDEALIVSDIHLGKAAAFRAAGVPVPSGATAKGLERLSALLHRTHARRLIILGDFFHARSGRSDSVLDAIGRWRRSHAGLPMLLVRGNHDRSAGRVLAEWNIEEADRSVEEDGLLLSHDPQPESDKPVLAGHVHPVYSIRDYDGASVKTPCFVFDERSASLPSFGTFTGGYRIAPEPGRRIYIIAGERIVQVPAQR
jgi:DNA ligase-associated metallophosphoesterase